MTIDATFLFADIAGFTALTEAHGDDHAAALADRFYAAVGAVATDFGADRVKSIGDAVMLKLDDPGRAIELGLRLADGVLGGHHAPAVRVGLHHGQAVCRNSDYFGSAVNIAARVAALARGGEVLLTAATGAAAAEPAGVRYETRGRHQLKGIGAPVELVAAVGAGTAAERLEIDPVCRMAVVPDRAAGRLMYGDEPYHFCGLDCAAAFARHPERYVR